jgi:putative heme-binding domain-containing protein
MLDLRIDRSLGQTFAYGLRPALGAFEIRDPYLIAGGDPSRSVLFYRVAKMGHGRMPHVGSAVVDEEGLELLGKWIAGLPGSPEDPASARARAEERELAEKPEAVLRLLGSTTGALDLMRLIDAGRLPEEARRRAIKEGISHSLDTVRGLFERFVPANERPRRLGTKIDPAQILAVSGSAERGRLLFFVGSGLQCRTCHMIEGRGESYGPDLSHIATKSSRAKILEDILQPSKEIDPKFATYVVRTESGAVHSGLLVENSEQAVVLKDAARNEVRIPKARVSQMVAQKTSSMPEFLLQSLTSQEAADLLEFLSSLK